MGSTEGSHHSPFCFLLEEWGHFLLLWCNNLLRCPPVALRLESATCFY